MKGDNKGAESQNMIADRGVLTALTAAALLVQVIVVEDENGNIVRETMKDTDTLARYKTMHETLVYLSHLDHDDTESQMLEKLRLQVGAASRSSACSDVARSCCGKMIAALISNAM